MEEYVKFHREITRRTLMVEDLMYYVKIERLRSYTQRDKKIRKNRLYREEQAALNHEVKASSMQY